MEIELNNFINKLPLLRSYPNDRFQTYLLVIKIIILWESKRSDVLFLFWPCPMISKRIWLKTTYQSDDRIDDTSYIGAQTLLILSAT